MAEAIMTAKWLDLSEGYDEFRYDHRRGRVIHRHVRGQYRRREGSTVWHFIRQCRWWPMNGNLEALLSKGLDVKYTRPRTGTLCDYCQRLEKTAKGK
jgi:hypothetical protein